MLIRLSSDFIRCSNNGLFLFQDLAQVHTAFNFHDSLVSWGSGTASQPFLVLIPLAFRNAGQASSGMSPNLSWSDVFLIELQWWGCRKDITEWSVLFITWSCFCDYLECYKDGRFCPLISEHESSHCKGIQGETHYPRHWWEILLEGSRRRRKTLSGMWQRTS